MKDKIATLVWWLVVLACKFGMALVSARFAWAAWRALEGHSLLVRIPVAVVTFFVVGGLIRLTFGLGLAVLAILTAAGQWISGRIDAAIRRRSSVASQPRR